ncbi:MAG: acyltransferase [Candidatus Eiseniibacteriota bacterium]|nr:MAG: acyltransferase [Candidatus Eisenbacteria bacterium]
MRIAFYQTSPVYGEIEYNVREALETLAAARADLYVLPELFSTGYLFGSRKELGRLVERVPEGPTVGVLHKFCRSRGCAIVASIAEVDRGNYYNSAVLISPRGLLGKYRKIHLFDRERLWFQPGNLDFGVWTFKRARIGLMICFDWVFPEAARVLALKGADIICHPSNLILHYCQDAMVTRSIENGVFTVTANRVGSERAEAVQLTFSGRSQITDPKGRVLARAPKVGRKFQVVDIDLSLTKKKKLTPRNHLFHDRRAKYYKEITRPTRR